MNSIDIKYMERNGVVIFSKAEWKKFNEFLAETYDIIIQKDEEIKIENKKGMDNL